MCNLNFIDHWFIIQTELSAVRNRIKTTLFTKNIYIFTWSHAWQLLSISQRKTVENRSLINQNRVVAQSLLNCVKWMLISSRWTVVVVMLLEYLLFFLQTEFHGNTISKDWYCLIADWWNILVTAFETNIKKKTNAIELSRSLPRHLYSSSKMVIDRSP